LASHFALRSILISNSASISLTRQQARLRINFNKKFTVKKRNEKNEWNEEKNDRKLYNNDHEIPKRSFTHTHGQTRWPAFDEFVFGIGD
jgi:chromatin remodeling complex protein RSC6